MAVISSSALGTTFGWNSTLLLTHSALTEFLRSDVRRSGSVPDLSGVLLQAYANLHLRQVSATRHVYATWMCTYASDSGRAGGLMSLAGLEQLLPMVLRTEPGRWMSCPFP
eukprot:scaffold655_cov379-Prasinococcus_capsulatus_cf.AAC.6